MLRFKRVVGLFSGLALLLVGSGLAQASWSKMTLKAGCKAMSFVDNDTGYLLRTTNTGQVKLHKIASGEWDAGTVVTGVTFLLQVNRLKFIDAQTGFVVANELKVYRTTDAGLTWTGVPVTLSPKGTSFPIILDIDFGTKTHGAIVGRTLDGGAFVAVTTDGGKTWNETAAKPGGSPYEVGMADGKTIVVGGHVNLGKVYISHDMGATWAEQKIRGKAVWDIEFISPTTGFILSQALGAAVTDNETVLKTTDGGKTWSAPYGGVLPIGPNAMSWVDANNGYLGGRLKGTVGMARTTDGGKTWKIEPTPTDPEYATAADTVYCLDYPGPGAYAGTTNGKTWQLKNASAGGKRASRYGGTTPAADAGPTTPDAGGTTSDGGTTPGADSSATSSDSGTGNGGGDDGGCAISADRPEVGLLVAGLGLVLLLGLRRRRVR